MTMAEIAQEAKIAVGVAMAILLFLAKFDFVSITKMEPN